jgi:hypothetical protein
MPRQEFSEISKDARPFNLEFASLGDDVAHEEDMEFSDVGTHRGVN